MSAPVVRTAPARAFLRAHWSLLALLVLSLAYIWSIVVLHGPGLSPIDEWGYIDYLMKVLGQGFVHEGEFIGESARQLLACNGLVAHGAVTIPCASAPGDPADFPYGGLAYTAPYLPVNFAITRVVGDGLAGIFGVDSLVGWRMVGWFWLAGALTFIHLIGRRLGLPTPVLFAIGLALVASPIAFWSFGYVSTDGPMLFFGALLLWLAMRFAAGEISGWWLVLAGAAGGAFKVTAALAGGLVLLHLLAVLLRERRRTLWRGLGTRRPEAPFRRSLGLIGFPLLALVASLVVSLGWMRLMPLLAVSDLRVDHGISIQLTIGELLPQVWNFLGLTIQSGIVWEPIPTYLYLPLSWLVVGGVVAAFAVLRRRSPHAALTTATLIAALIASPAMAIAFQLATSTYYEMPARYGIGLLPALLVVAGLAFRNRFMPWIVAGYSLALMVFGLTLAYQFGLNQL